MKSVENKVVVVKEAVYVISTSSGFLIVSYSLLSRRNELRLGVSLVTGSKLGSPKRVIGKVIS